MLPVHTEYGYVFTFRHAWLTLVGPCGLHTVVGAKPVTIDEVDLYSQLAIWQGEGPGAVVNEGVVHCVQTAGQICTQKAPRWSQR